MADDTSVKTQQLEELQEATNRLIRTVDGFTGDDWDAVAAKLEKGTIKAQR